MIYFIRNCIKKRLTNTQFVIVLPILTGSSRHFNDLTFTVMKALLKYNIIHSNEHKMVSTNKDTIKIPSLFYCCVCSLKNIQAAHIHLHILNKIHHSSSNYMKKLPRPPPIIHSMFFIRYWCCSHPVCVYHENKIQFLWTHAFPAFPKLHGKY